MRVIGNGNNRDWPGRPTDAQIGLWIAQEHGPVPLPAMTVRAARRWALRERARGDAWRDALTGWTLAALAVGIVVGWLVRR